MKRFFILSSFFIAAPAVFGISLLYLLFVSYHKTPTANHDKSASNNVAYASVPTTQSVLSENITSSEAKVEIIRQFLAKYNSPLEPHAKLIVDTAEKYNLDSRLIPAIAMQESNLCKKSRPEAFNCWGFGIYGDKYLHFDSYEHGIETVTKTLATKYKDKHGLVTPEEIMKMYTPNSNGSWAFSVNYFMKSME